MGQVESSTQLAVSVHEDVKWMDLALVEARNAALRSEVPVGAIIMQRGVLIASAGNRKEGGFDPTGHAEIIAIRSAADKLTNWRLTGCMLYVTLEPCLMCTGAILQARIESVVFGTRDPKGGAVVSLYQALEDPRLNHHVQIREGVRSDEAAFLLSRFFQQKRGKTAPIR